MTDLVLALIPDYGLYIIFGVVCLACLAVPLPASMLVLASGAFSATEDLTLWQVLLVTFIAFVIGDQIAFRIASNLGPSILSRWRHKPRFASIIARSEALLAQKGQTAVLLSHTILSPTCPYISYLCGMGGMKWQAFSGVAFFGAGIWVSVYVGLGYVFATQIAQVADLLSQFFGFAFAGACVIFCIMWLRKQWRSHQLQS